MIANAHAQLEGSSGQELPGQGGLRLKGYVSNRTVEAAFISQPECQPANSQPVS